MTNLLEIGLSNAVVATLLAVMVWLVTRVWRHPVLAQALWLVVLVKLITPPLISVPWRVATDSAASRFRGISHSDVGQFEAINISNVDGANVDDTVVRSELIRPEFDQTPATAENDDTFLEPLPPVDRATPFSLVRFRWPAVAVWLGGSAIWFVVTLLRLIRFQRALAGTEPVSDQIQQWADDVALKLGVAPGYRLRITEGRVSPMVWPLGRPTIVLPRPLVEQLSPAETHTLLAHEFAHLRRKDHWVRWLELVVATIYWWHPVVWWARRMIHRAEERACDAWVVWAFPDAAQRYAAALLKAVEYASEPRQPIPLLASRLTAGGDLKERIEHVMNATWTRRLSWRLRLGVLALALAILPFSLRAVQAADGGPPKPIVPHQAGVVDQSPPASEATEDQPSETDANALRIRPGIILRIRVRGASPYQTVGGEHDSLPIASDCVVEPGGGVALGPHYGRIHLAGMTIAEAEAALTQHLQTVVTDPQVQITLVDEQAVRESVDVPVDPYHISPGDVLLVTVLGALPDMPIADDFVVEPSGTLALGPAYGRVRVSGLTLEGAEQAIDQQLRKTLENPVVQVTLGGWRAGGRSTPTQLANRTSVDERPLPWETAATRLRPEPELASREELDALREHVTILEELFKRTETVYRAREARIESVATAGYELALAKGELALAEGDRDAALESFEKAQAYAEQASKSVTAAYREGRATYDIVLQAANNLAESKRRLLRLRQSQASTTSSQQRTFDDSGRLQRELAQPTPGSESSTSISVWKKIVESKKRTYERIQSLALNDADSATVLEKAKNEYEISVAKYEQAMRALEYYQLLVELAEAEYQQAIEINKSAPNSISEFELRKLRFKVDLAKAKLSELAE